MHTLPEHRAAVLAVLLAACLACAGATACSAPHEPETKDPTSMIENTVGKSDAAHMEDKTEEPEKPAEVVEEDPAKVQMKAAKKAAKKAIGGYRDVSVAVARTDGGGEFDIRGDKKYVSASMIKLLILAEFMAQVDDGEISLSDEYTLESEDIVGGTSHIAEQGAGSVFTYDELAEYMISYSDNTATNILIDILKMSCINERAEILGLQHTDLQRKMMDLDSGVENHMSPNDAVAILRGIANHDIASKKMCKRAEKYLKAQTDNEGLAEGVPAEVPFGHKTGTLDPNRHDAGIVYAEEPYVIAFFSTDNATETANDLMARTSAAVFKKLAD